MAQKRYRIIGLLAAIALLLSACATHQGPRETSGMLIGGIVGGVLGNQIGHGTGRTVATIAGAVIGTAVGGSIGRSMDETDRLKAAHSLENVRTGVRSSWRNPDTGYEYEMVPTRTYDRDGVPCREYQMTATIGGRAEEVYGTACRQPDGSWKVVD